MANHRVIPIRRAQVILSYILVFIATLGLVIGVVRIWIWFNANYAHRQVAYQTSRIIAGKPKYYTDTSSAASYTYIDISGEDTTAQPSLKYRPLNLNEDWVFRGIISGQGGSFGGGDLSFSQMQDNCKAYCLEEPGCKDTIDDFDSNCGCYVTCLCQAQTQTSLNMLQQQADNMKTQAGSLRNNAREMCRQANKCRYFWQLCWWGNWGKTSRELRRAARELEKMADDLDARAVSIEDTISKITNCCKITDYDAQQACLDFVQGQSCEDIVSNLKTGWNEELIRLKSEKEAIERIVNGISSGINTCNSTAQSDCSSCVATDEDGSCVKWAWQDLGYSDYNACYQGRRNSCCYTFCCTEEAESCCVNCGSCGGWNRACDEPSTDCDEAANPDNPIDCGLSALKRNLENKLNNEIEPGIRRLELRIERVSECCSYSAQAQLDCISRAAQ
jgi:hypothetical protein